MADGEKVGVCLVCGGAVTDRRRSTCSPLCRDICARAQRKRHDRRRNPAYWARKQARRQARIKERLATDPAFREKKRAIMRKHYLAHAEKYRAQSRAYAAIHPDYFRQKNLEWRARQALTPEGVAKREALERRVAEREQRERIAAERRRLLHDPVEQEKRRLARWRRRRMSLKAREQHRASDRKRAAERNAIFGALRELGWIKGLDLVEPTAPIAAAPLQLPAPGPIKLERPAWHRLMQSRLTEIAPALPGRIVVVDRQGIARIVAIRGSKRGRPRLSDTDATLRRNFALARASARLRKLCKRGRPPLGLTEVEKAARKRHQDRLWRAANAHTAEFKAKRAEQGRRYRLKRDALLAAARELGLFEAEQQ